MPALTYESKFTVSGWGINRAGVLGSDTANLYAYRANNGELRTYTAGGTLSNTRTLSLPSRPSGVPSSAGSPTFGNIVGIEYYNGSFYILWILSDDRNRNRYTMLDRYNTSFVHQENLWHITGKTYVGMSIVNDKIYTSNTRRPYSIDIINLSNGALVTGTNSFSVSRIVYDVAVGDTRIYTSESDSTIRAYTLTGTAISADNTFRSDLDRSRGITIIGSDLYAIDRGDIDDRQTEIFKFSGVPVVAPYSATWATPTYESTDRSISAALTLSENPGSAFSASADFKVQVQAGAAWNDSSGWTISATGATTSRTITARPSNAVDAGTYRIVLIKDAFGSGKPADDVVTTGRTIEEYKAPPMDYMATFGSASPASDRSATVSLTLSEDPGANFDAALDFIVQERTGTSPNYVYRTSSGWTFSSSGTGTTRTITAVPASTVAAGTYRIQLLEDAFGTGKPDDAVNSNAFQIAAYVAPPTPTITDTSRITYLERGDTLDLNQFVDGADTITFRQGSTAPFGLTISNGILKVPDDADSVDAPQAVQVTGSNAFGSTHVSFQMQIVNSAIDTRDRSFQQKAPQWTVTINGIDVSEHVESVDRIRHNLDLYDTGEFNVAECSVVLNNELRLYQRGGPFYSDNNINPFAATIVVSGKLGSIDRRMFTGTILSITDNTQPQQEVSLLCIEDTRELREKQVIDFGVDKYNVQVIREQEGISGTYSIPESLTPVVDESLEATTEGRSLNVQIDNELPVFGRFDFNNVKQGESIVRTEGGFLPESPVIDIKSPHTYSQVSTYLNELLAHEGVSSRSIEVPTYTTGELYVSSGRVAHNDDFSEIQRYTKDWIYDSTSKTFYVLHGSPLAGVQDQLWSWNTEIDTWELIKAFDSEHELWMLASADYEDFYVMGTEARSDLSYIPQGTYDASEGNSKVFILKFDKSADSVTEFVRPTQSFTPTLAHHYAVGFPRDNANSHRFGNVPDTRGGFEIRSGHLYYRYASETAYGVAEVNLSSGARSGFFTITPTADIYTNKATCVFDIHEDRMYIAFVEGTNNHAGGPGSLSVIYRTFASSTVNEIWNSIQSASSTNFSIQSRFSRGARFSPLEIFVNDTDDIYLVAQNYLGTFVVRNEFPEIDPDEHHFQDNAFASLYHLDGRTTTPVVLKDYNYSQIAARSFVNHDNYVYFFEGSPIQYKYEPILPAGIVESEQIAISAYGSQVVPEIDWRGRVGFLNRIDSSDIGTVTAFSGGEQFGAVERVGLTFRSALEDPNDPDNRFYGIHGATVSPMISTDDNLYIVSAYGDFDRIGDPDADIGHIFNDAIITFGTNQQFRIPRLSTNQKTGYDVLREIANSTNSIFGVNQQRFFWKTRENTEAQLSAALASDAVALSYDSEIGTFADSGFAKIDDEVVSYTSKNNTQLLGLVRGLSGTTAASHVDNSFVLHVDHVIDGTAIASPISRVQVRDDYTNLRNSIFINYGEGVSVYHTKDDASIALYGEKEHQVQTFLDFTQRDFAKQLGDNYLRVFKNLEQIVAFESDLALFLSVGDIIYLQTKEISAAMRIYELEHDFQRAETSVVARTISY